MEGVRQHNLKNLSLEIPLGKLTVVTGVSGSGKSSLAFDTLYAEGQRRYVETFSPYARQFLDRMDKPQVDRISGIPPAIAIDQTNPVRTSRSTVGTMTELNDHLKLLFARAARLHCRACDRPVHRDTPQSIFDQLKSLLSAGPGDALITFPVKIPVSFTEAEVRQLLERQGYSRILFRKDADLEVIQDRLAFRPDHRARWLEDLETALRHGRGRVAVRPLAPDGTPGEPLRFSEALHCAECDIVYRDPLPNHFSFNSPLGACETCRGFGRTIAVDYGLVIPDETRTLAGGAIRPWQTGISRECQDDLMRAARRAKIPAQIPWRDLSEAQRTWVLEGEGRWEDKKWYGVRRFFEWLEKKAYKMHIRVLLSKYRAYWECPTCHGARLKPDALLWRLGRGKGLTLHELMELSIEEARSFFKSLTLPSPLDQAVAQLTDSIRTRLDYLCEVGLGYLTLDRQSRTLSGGEVQRINLTTALGTSLVNTLFVLDEPSAGLHSRDIGRLIRILHRLRDAGNTLIVVEHDPEVIRAADRVIDLGPGPGEQGGRIVFHGTFPRLLRSRKSLTSDYLNGRLRVSDESGDSRKEVLADTPRIEILGAAEHNLKQIDVRIPLGRMVCLTGVSGSGKSTLVQNILYPALLRHFGRPTEAPGRHTSLRGMESLHGVRLVDQAPVGKTSRSNPASFVGAFDAIRKRFVEVPEARARQYTPGTFSFNSGKGRCPACRGSGFERVEMQFLSDVYLRCPDCDGRRYRAETLEIRISGSCGTTSASIADVLEMTVSEACLFFSDQPDILRGLAPLRAAGLDYLRLGQPVPTLSGGEAQRLKFAGHLAGTEETALPHLFLFDEPTTGLHLHDIAVLLRALRQLIHRGHSVLVIEHHLEVIRAADWIIDLGPEGGIEGGGLVAEGTPDQIAACKTSHTGAALRQITGAGRAPAKGALCAAAETSPAIRIFNARENNLRGINASIPRDRLTVITGVSGSGKSTLAFNILFGEGQRRYLESLNAYARQFVQPAARPEVDRVEGIPPTVAIEQRTSRGGRKSTVATLTEAYHFLRLLFVKLGVQHCPDCRLPIMPQSEAAIADRILREYRGRSVHLLAPAVLARKGIYTELAHRAARKGIRRLRVDGQWLPTEPWPGLDRFREHTIDVPTAFLRIEPVQSEVLRAALHQALEQGGQSCRILSEDRGSAGEPVFFSTRRACPKCNRSFPELDPRLFSFNSRQGWCPDCFGTGLRMKGFDADQTGEEIWWNAWWGGEAIPCPSCDGKRLRSEALAVQYRGRSIAEMTAWTIAQAARELDALRLDGREADIARDLLAELRGRLGFLLSVGLSYLTLDRAAPTLSGGEAQRIRLAAQLGSNLRGVCYILDEPTIGLHPRDNRMLLDTLRGLKDRGNTVVIVEHDEETIREADHILDLGPGAGANGGRIVAEGTLRDLIRSGDSTTARCLKTPAVHPVRGVRRPVLPQGPRLRVRKAVLHNLRLLDLRIPLGRLVCVTGVSGSGKSTLMRHVLHDNLQTALAARGRKMKWTGCRQIEGVELIRRVLEVDQTPIGKTPRSCPATYVGFWDTIRRLFAEVPDARVRGYTASRFSFNVKGGRCEVCEGQGLQRVEMSFLPDVTVRCEACEGRRFTPDTLAVTWAGKTVHEVLAMSVDEAVVHFAAQPSLHRPLSLLQEVGLGYLTLGQQSPTLSGGEAQRIKLVTELAKARESTPGPRRAASAIPGGTLYLLDEPTVGLHMADVEKLVRVLHRLVDAGNSVILIEHNLDIMAEADWILDLGPEGGDGGGRLVAEGAPDGIANIRESRTARWLKPFLARARRQPVRRGA